MKKSTAHGLCVYLRDNFPHTHTPHTGPATHSIVREQFPNLNSLKFDYCSVHFWALRLK